MFNSARIKLTFWYFLIIALITVSFSVAIYEVLTIELDRVERLQRYRIERSIPTDPFMESNPDNSDRIYVRGPAIDPAIVAETKNRLKFILFLIDLGVISATTIAAFFLSGRTLRPIKVMVDEQHRFITDASHELRTPLTSLKTSIEVFLRDKKHTLKDSEQLIKSNLEEINSLQVLSDDLLALAQYQKPTTDLIFVNLNLREVLEISIKKILPIASTKHIAIKKDLKDIFIEGNQQTLTELFVIILDNAIKYSDKKTNIKIANHSTDGHVIVEISDQGIGISEEDLPHLFDRFFRASKSRSKTEVSGYGLGLSIAKKIVNSHKGSIRVKSEVSKGSTFLIELPKKQSKILI